MLRHSQLWLLIAAATFTSSRRTPRSRILRPRDTTYSQNTEDTTPAGSFGTPGETTTVDSGVTYLLNGLSPHPFFGNVVNSGNIVVTQGGFFFGDNGFFSTPLVSTYTSADTSTANGGDDGVLVTNSGSLITLNDYDDTSYGSPSVYTWELYSMTNGGTMQWCGNGNPASGSQMALTCLSDMCINNGLIDWEQYNAANGVSFFWAAGVTPGTSPGDIGGNNGNNGNSGGQSSSSLSGFNPTNNGAFRLINVALQLFQDVVSTATGGGCFVLGKEGLLSLENGVQGVNSNTKTFATQSIYFTDNTGGLFINPTVYATNTNFGATLYGFGSGNYIAFSEPLAFGTPYSYAVTGTLTVKFQSGTSIVINIGVGYTASSFSSRSTNSGNFYGVDPRAASAESVILYNAAAPVAVPPSVCDVTYPVCENPSEQVTATFASTILPPYTTVTSTSTGLTSTITTTEVSASASRTGTVEVIVPAPYSTVTTTSTGLASPYTTTIPPTNGRAGTVEIVEPAGYVTITSTSTGLASPTTTTISPSNTAAGTVEIIVPAQFVTSTTYSGSADPFTTTIQPSGTAGGTVLIVDPLSYTTITVTSTGATSLTTYTVTPTGTAEGTVVIVDPAATNYVTTTIPYTGTDPYTTVITVSSMDPSGTNPGTVYVSIVDAVLATQTMGYSGDVASTTTVAGVNGAQPTVEVFVPTTTRPATIRTTVGPNQCICRPRTSTSAAAAATT